MEQSYRSRGRPSKFLSARTHARAVRGSLQCSAHAQSRRYCAPSGRRFSSRQITTCNFFKESRIHHGILSLPVIGHGSLKKRRDGAALRVRARGARACVCARRRLKAGPRATRRQLLPGRLTISCAVMRRCQISATLPTSRPAATALRGRRSTHFQLSNLNFTGANSPSEGRLVVKKQTNLV